MARKQKLTKEEIAEKEYWDKQAALDPGESPIDRLALNLSLADMNWRRIRRHRSQSRYSILDSA